MGRRKRDRRSRASQATTASGRGGSPADADSPTERLRPWLLGGMCALFVARPLFPSDSPASLGDGLPVVMLWVALAVFWLFGAIRGPRFRVRFGWTDAAVVLLLVLHTIAAVWAATRVSPRPAVNTLWEWLGMGLAFLLARQLIIGRREARAVVAVMIALAVVLSGYGLYQYFYELPATREIYQQDPERAMREAGLWFEAGSPEQQLFEDRLQSTEPIATFALANSLAGYLAPWLVMLAGIAVSALQSRSLPRRIWPMFAFWVAVIGSGGLIGFCLLLTKSRSAWMATALGLLLVVLLLVWILWQQLAGRFGWKLGGARALAGTLIIAAAVFLAGGALITAAVASGGLDREVLSEASKSLGYRVQYWQSTLGMIADHPLVGCGPGNFQHTYTGYKLPEASEEVADPHNFLLEVWATAGTPAMLALLAVLGSFAGAVWRHRGYEGHFLSLGERAGMGVGEKKDTGQSSHGDALPEDEVTADSPAYVFGGAVFGFLLAVPLGLISGAPPAIVADLIGPKAVLAALILSVLFGMAAACVGLLSGWVYRGRMLRLLPAIGVVVLLVNLLAAGGIGFPGVAGSLWLLLALGLNAAEADRLPQMLPRSVAVVGLCTAVALGVACYASAYGPVLRCQSKMRLAQRQPAKAEEYLLAAAKADPLSAQPWQQLAGFAFGAWQENFSPERFEQFERYNATALKLAPNSSLAWLASGDRYRKAYSIAGRQSDVEKAVEAYTRAVELYPNSGLYRANLALALQAAGNQDAFRRQADEALRLDAKTPHADKKLPDELRRQLLPKQGGL